MLKTMKEPPPRGSIQESVLQALIIRLDQVEYAKTRTMVVAVLQAGAEDTKEIQKELDLYRDVQFPYYKNIQRSEKDGHIQKLQQEIARGPLVVTAAPEKKIRSKLKTRVIQRMTPEQKEAIRRVSKKLPRMM